MLTAAYVVLAVVGFGCLSLGAQMGHCPPPSMSEARRYATMALAFVGCMGCVGGVLLLGR